VEPVDRRGRGARNTCLEIRYAGSGNAFKGTVQGISENAMKTPSKTKNDQNFQTVEEMGIPWPKTSPSLIIIGRLSVIGRKGGPVLHNRTRNALGEMNGRAKAEVRGGRRRAGNSKLDLRQTCGLENEAEVHEIGLRTLRRGARNKKSSEGGRGIKKKIMILRKKKKRKGCLGEGKKHNATWWTRDPNSSIKFVER